MSEFPKKKLGQIADFLNGGTPSRKVPEYFQGSIPWITGIDVVDFRTKKAREYITEEAIKHSATHIVPRGSVLFVTRTGVGKVSIADVDICISQDLTGVVPKNGVNSEYLARYLLSITNRLKERQRGSTILGITRGFVEDLEIPLPPLPIQKQIAAILEKADAAREKRRQANQLTEQFLQSAFLEMFGDPVTNPKGWRVVKLGDILERIDSGKSPVCHKRAASPDEWGVLKLGAVTPGRFDDSENKALPDSAEPSQEDEVHQGDVLLVRKNTYELVGRTAFVFRTRPKLLMSDLTFRLAFKKEIVAGEYLWYVMNQQPIQSRVQRLSGGSAGSMPNVSKERLKTLELVLPPLSKQKKFAALVEKVESLRAKQRESEKELENLFNSLMQKAFKGELVS